MPEPHWAGRAPASSGGGDGGSMTLSGLTDVSGPPADGHGPVYNSQGVADLIPVVKQEDLDAILEQVVWRKAPNIDAPWQPSNPTVVMTPDGVRFGPYPDGAQGGSLRYLGLNGQPMSAVTNLAFQMNYIEDGMHAELSPYLRIFTTDSGGTAHDAIYSPGSQAYPGQGCGPMQELVATAGTWRYDNDDGSGGVPFADIVAEHGTETITKIAITLGFTAGINLTGLLRRWQINGLTWVFCQ